LITVKAEADVVPFLEDGLLHPLPVHDGPVRALEVDDDVVVLEPTRSGSAPGDLPSVSFKSVVTARPILMRSSRPAGRSSPCPCVDHDEGGEIRHLPRGDAPVLGLSVLLVRVGSRGGQPARHGVVDQVEMQLHIADLDRVARSQLRLLHLLTVDEEPPRGPQVMDGVLQIFPEQPEVGEGDGVVLQDVCGSPANGLLRKR